ncbi:hypothetical protein FSP39_023910 [Pinctada imbricata]|uniref:Cysteine and histidine-rich domain-containing protein 1 n=1 Tax=Pinctada imbricata TaxID=66713 RepID=A0AA89C2R0_PINIB|nr:hypothetical protein FSP39_023910 [Pinctada imbricata]
MSNLVHCYNKGCGKKFDVADNNDDSCQFHPGGPVFHDAMKGWSCCKKRSTDFTEFLNFPGCTRGKHSNDKPPEPEKKQNVPLEKDEVIEVKIREPQKPRDPLDRPSDDEPLIPLNVTVSSSLKQALHRHMEKLSLEPQTVENDSSEVQLGTSCKNNACKACYQGEHSNNETCRYHPGVPIFHEGLKFWSCCRRRTTEFDVFLDQEGCETGKHLWIKPNVAGEKKSCRFDWHQTNSYMTISVYSKVTMPEKCIIKANRVRCDISIVFDGGNSLFENNIILREVIDPVNSQVKMMGTKVEINLRKVESFSWPSLELPAQTDSQQLDNDNDTPDS